MKMLTAPSYKLQCTTLLPQLEHVCTHLDDPYVMSFCGQESQVTQVTEVFLSASHFGDHSWKTKCISLASQTLTNSVTRHSQENLVLEARVRTRQALISHAYESGSYEEIPWPYIDHRSNAFSADAVLLKAESCIRFYAPLSAHKALESYNPFVYGSISTFEKLQAEEVTFCRSRLALLEGRFDIAYSTLSELPRTKEQVALYLAVVLCELGRSKEAEDLFELPPLSVPLQSNQHQLAAANVRLCRCMDALRQNTYDRHYAQETRSMYQGLQGQHDLATFSGQRDCFMVLSGIAILDHVDGRLDSAMERWEEALAYCKKYRIGGFTNMIVAYSMGELELRRGNTLESEYLRAKTRSLFASTGRQYHFPGLGSAWPDILGHWYESWGCDRVIPRLNNEMIR